MDTLTRALMRFSRDRQAANASLSADHPPKTGLLLIITGQTNRRERTSERRGAAGWKMANEAIRQPEFDLFFVKHIFVKRMCAIEKRKKEIKAECSLKLCATKEALLKSLRRRAARQSDSCCESATGIGAAAISEGWRCDMEVVSGGQRPGTPHQTEMVMSAG